MTGDSKTNRVPAVTIAVTLFTAAVSIVALTHPDLLRSLQRHPTPDAHWLSWRLLTSLLVHDGWLQLAFNLLGLAVVGASMERLLGPDRWIALYLIGGIVGQIAGMWWQPVGAGNSVATFGLVGGLVAMLLDRGNTRVTLAVLYAVEWVLVYTGLELGGIRGAVIAGVLCIPLGTLVSRARNSTPRALGVSLAIGTLVLALALCAVRDIHGPPLIAGAIIGLLFSFLSSSTAQA